MNETLHTLALTFLKGLGALQALKCYEHYGSAEAVFADRKPQEPKLKAALAHAPEALAMAEAELAFCEDKRIRVLTRADADYPARLRECSDAPLALFYRGSADLNARHVVSVVGTRRITEYGKDLCRHFCEDLRQLLPDTLVVSGLAYGVDIHAHRESLRNGLDTLAVLAHGLDRLYPSAHRETAAQMVQQGGLLTEYPTHTNPDKGNFVRRNRIVAGLADATVVVESAEKGGALITARLAQDYSRDVFAFPGRTSDTYSTGCNALIRNNGAALLTDAEGLVEAMRWERSDKGRMPEAVQRELFPELSADEKRITDVMAGADNLSTAQLLNEIPFPFSRLNALLHGLELKGVVKELPGGKFRLLK